MVGALAYAGTLLAPLAGWLADRTAQRRLLIRMNVIAALTVAALLLVRSRADTWVVFLAMAAYGIEATLMSPAEDALFAQMFSADLRRSINGWRLTIQEAGRLVSPLLGAALFVQLGGSAVAGLDAATFLIAALATSRLRVTEARPTATRAQPTTPVAKQLLAGVSQIRTAPGLRPVVLAASAVMALSGVGVAAQYSLVHGIGQRPAFLGVLSALLGAGSIIASLSAGPVARRFGERRLALLGLLDFAAGTALRANHSLPAAIAGTLALGFALPYVFLATLNLAQRLTPDELQGRVSAALSLALFGPQAPMQALGSLLIAHSSYIAIYVGEAAVSLAIAIWLAVGTRAAPASGIPT